MNPRTSMINGNATREMLANVVTPAPSKNYVPVPFSEFVDLVEDRCHNQNFEIVDSCFELSRANKVKGETDLTTAQRMFGVLVLKDKERDWISPVLGLRSGHDKHLSLQMALGGTRVTVCSNMEFAGEIVTCRKHTGSIKARMSDWITLALSKQRDSYAEQIERIEAYKGVELPNDGAFADHLIVQAVEAGVISQKFPVWSGVKNEYLEPSHAEHLVDGKHTAYTFWNACTDSWKDSSMMNVPDQSRKLTDFMKLAVLNN